ncbi:twin-arginine translocase TatA/TatE family subunit [Haloplanus pelagicus]|jgi:sec-independent protein translocase protein TatA|uniref:twin-arginine translocase TatA/TatE family subunit n=1 Tax=Haloplanus pelagicus TaxID=2949995 RepID=UPI00203DFB60|nr:twin-arginine translocase TatA/TatE family subunit [Haloplanus sp. HW8-1]
MYDSIIPLFPGLPGGPELLIVLFVLVLLFGANKIPKLARSTGQAMGEFKRGREEIEEELQEGVESSDTDATAATGETTETTETDAERSN